MARLIPLSVVLLAAGLAPTALAWGSMGHETIAYLATSFVLPETKTYMQQLLDDTSGDYLASVASWADSYRATREGAFSAPYHFVDARDDPPSSCGVDLNRDCAAAKGCILTALANYTRQMMMQPQEQRHDDRADLLAQRRLAAKMVIHLVGDVGQPLHCENLDVGGNDVPVEFDGAETNLHAAWDTSIPVSMSGANTMAAAKTWAAALSEEVRSGEFEAAVAAGEWDQGLSLDEPEDTALAWAGESNAFVCSVVLPDGTQAVQGQDIGGAYTTSVQPTVKLQIAKQGYRLAKWLDAIVAEIK